MTSVQVGAEGDLLTIRVDLAETARDLAQRLEECQQATERARQRWEESEWFLGEARALIAELETQLQAKTEAHAQLEASHQDIETRLQDAERQRDEATRLLEALRQAHQELMAMGTAGERRRASRARRGDITVELQRPDGTVLFHGPVRDISRTGMGFACEQSVDGAPELLWVTLHPGGLERPIEAIARLAWLRQEDADGSYAGGCELLDVSPGSRGAFEEILNHHSA
jgi:Rad3-related DNA helicase